MSYRVLGSSNGLVYERARADSSEAAVETARAITEGSIGSTGVINTWVVDPEGRQIYDCRVNARTEEVEETDLRERDAA